jgi:hypothetical protein
MARLTTILAFAAALTACGGCTMTKADMTAESKARDRYECEQETYGAANGNAMLLSNGFYRDCMRARGYK